MEKDDLSISKDIIPQKVSDQDVYFYPEKEERINIITHAIGFLASIIGGYLLLSKSTYLEGPKYFMSYVIYSLSLMALYAASTLYHSAKDVRSRRILNIVDHSAIYLLIAGTYTPLMLVTLEGKSGWTVFTVVWVIAFVGIILKLFFIGKYERLSTSMYVVMGWIVLFVIKPLIAALPTSALVLLVLGGVLYSVGALFYSIKKLPFNHAIFHFFVLGGSLSHFLCIYHYV